MGAIKLPHASGNSMSIAAPATNPASDLELKLPATIGTATQYLRNGATAGTLEFAPAPLSEVSFCSTLSAAQTISHSTMTTVICNSVKWNIASGYNGSTGEFTIPSGKGGRYMIGYSLRWYDIDNDDVCQGRLYKNGAHGNDQYRWRTQLQAYKDNVYVYLATSNVAEFAAADVLTFQVHQTTSSTADLAAHYTSFWGMKIED
jgi:hypothetical protein